MKEKEEELKEKDRLLANAIEGMRGKGMDTGAIASIWGCLKQQWIGTCMDHLPTYKQTACDSRG